MSSFFFNPNKKFAELEDWNKLNCRFSLPSLLLIWYIDEYKLQNNVSSSRVKNRFFSHCHLLSPAYLKWSSEKPHVCEMVVALMAQHISSLDFHYLERTQRRQRMNEVTTSLDIIGRRDSSFSMLHWISSSNGTQHKNMLETYNPFTSCMNASDFIFLQLLLATDALQSVSLRAWRLSDRLIITKDLLQQLLYFSCLYLLIGLISMMAHVSYESHGPCQQNWHHLLLETSHLHLVRKSKSRNSFILKLQFCY